MSSDFIDKWASQVKKGTLSFIVLNTLQKKEMYGYELIEEIRKFTAIEIAEGTLYPLMNRLKEDGVISSRWVEQNTGIPRKYYTLTTNGADTLNEMRIYWNNLQGAIKKIQQ